MLPRSFRLPPSEFTSRGYKTWKTPYFSLKAKPNGLLKNRIGVIISVAAVKTAVSRNFWKRQAKQAISNFQFPISEQTEKNTEIPKQHFDFLLIFFKPINALTKAQFKKELSEALSKKI